jgi:hypothetical protein
MILQLRVALFSAFIGLFVGFFWEGYGAFYLWTLASPKFIIFGLAMIAWSIIGIAMATVLRWIETISPCCKIFFKPLIGPLALVIAKITNVVGIISFPSTKPLIFGVPLYMMIGLLLLVYLLDDLLHFLRKQ